MASAAPAILSSEPTNQIPSNRDCLTPARSSSDVTYRTSFVSRKWNKNSTDPSKRNTVNSTTRSRVPSSDLNTTVTSTSDEGDQAGSSDGWTSGESPPPPSYATSTGSGHRSKTKGSKKKRKVRGQQEPPVHQHHAVENMPSRRTNELHHVFPELNSLEVAVDGEEDLLQVNDYESRFDPSLYHP